MAIPANWSMVRLVGFLVDDDGDPVTDYTLTVQSSQSRLQDNTSRRVVFPKPDVLTPAVADGYFWVDVVSDTDTDLSPSGRQHKVTLSKAGAAVQSWFVTVDHAAATQLRFDNATQAIVGSGGTQRDAVYLTSLQDFSDAPVVGGSGGSVGTAITNAITAHKAESDPHTQYALDSDLTAKANASDLTAHSTATNNPHSVTKSQVGLGSVDNTADTAKPVSTAQQAALDAKAPLASPAFTGTPTGITKAHVGLGNVDNTSDAAKQTANDARYLPKPDETGASVGQDYAFRKTSGGYALADLATRKGRYPSGSRPFGPATTLTSSGTTRAVGYDPVTGILICATQTNIAASPDGGATLGGPMGVPISGQTNTGNQIGRIVRFGTLWLCLINNLSLGLAEIYSSPAPSAFNGTCTWTLRQQLTAGSDGRFFTALDAGATAAVAGEYGDPVSGGRTVTDAVFTSGSTTITSATAAFTSGDVGKNVIAPGLVSVSAVIASVTNGTTAVLSAAAQGSGSGQTLTIGTRNPKLWRTTDGLTWTTVWQASGGNNRHVHAVAADPYTAGNWYMTNGDGPSPCLVKSTDDGQTWTGMPILPSSRQAVQISFTPEFIWLAPDTSQGAVWLVDRATGTTIKTGSVSDHRRIAVPTPGLHPFGYWTSGSAVINDYTNNPFTQDMVGAKVTGAGIPAGTTILSVQNGSQATMSANATASASAQPYRIFQPEHFWSDNFFGAVDPATGAYYFLAVGNSDMPNNGGRRGLFYVPFPGGPVELLDMVLSTANTLFIAGGQVYAGAYRRPLMTFAD